MSIKGLAKRMSIRVQLFAAFGTLLVVMLGLGLFSLNQTGVVRLAAVDLETNWLASVRRLGELDVAGSEHRFNLAAHILNPDPDTKRSFDENMAKAKQSVAEVRAKYELLATSAEEQRLLPELMLQWDAYLREASEVAQLSSAGTEASAGGALERRAIPAFRKFRETLNRLTEISVTGAAEAGRLAGQTYDRSTALVTGLFVAATLLGTTLAFLIARAINGGLSGLLGAMRSLTAGDLAVEVPSRGERTEIGALADGVQAFKEALIEKQRADQAAVAEATVKTGRAAHIDRLVRDFEAEAAGVLRAVAVASTKLDATAAEMAHTAGDGVSQAGSVAAAAEQASVNVQTVAASAEELASSISEVARQVTESAQVARQMAEDARATDSVVSSLSETTGRIGEVVKLIAGIAGQTNLLALNATIEAARAGEHGKGFAVVASEVKALATQTAKATGEIGVQIAAMQVETTRAVDAIKSIGRTIEEMNGLTTQVAAAAEEQSAATRKIGRAVAEAAAGTQDASHHASGLAEGALRTGTAASEVRAASGKLAQQAEGLHEQVDTFLANIRAA